jgi:polysaccharide export outer membrane protein
VFILRFEEVAFMRKLFLARDFSRFEGLVPVVYRLKLKDASSFFLAKRFPIRNKDILYISNAPLSDVSKILTLFNLALTPVSRANGLAQ